MAFVSEMFDQLRDLLNDAADSQVPFAMKKLYLNLGIKRLWPRLFKLTTTTVAYADNAISDSALSIGDGMIVSVEYSYDSDADNYQRTSLYDVLPGDEDQTTTFYPTFVPDAGSTFRIVYAAPIPLISAASYAAAQSETWAAPDRVIGLPVLYAMGLIAGRRLDDRQDHTRYSTTQNANGVSDNDIMQSSSYWMSQFDAELVDMERPLQPSRD